MTQHVVTLPAGGNLTLSDADEVTMWQDAANTYVQDYGLVKTNDLVLLGALLSQQLAMYRAQRKLNDDDATVRSNAQKEIVKASQEIREVEKALGIDRKSREAGGKDTIDDYLTRAKRAAHAKGIRISERVKEYEAFNMRLRTMIRVLRNCDVEDRAHEGVSEKSIVEFAERELARIEEQDKEWAREHGAIFVGKL